MTCYHCETENPENAVYCKNCGRRLDGMSVCAYCGKTTPQDGDFCIHCGFNRNMAYDGAALPVAGGYAARRERTPRADSAERTARREKIMTNIALACTILTILVSVVFVFLIGAAFGVSTGGVSARGADGGGQRRGASAPAYSAECPPAGGKARECPLCGARRRLRRYPA